MNFNNQNQMGYYQNNGASNVMPKNIIEYVGPQRVSSDSNNIREMVNPELYYVMINKRYIYISNDIQLIASNEKNCPVQDTIGMIRVTFSTFDDALRYVNGFIIKLMGCVYNWKLYDKDVPFGIPNDEKYLNTRIELAQFVPLEIVSKLDLIYIGSN